MMQPEKKIWGQTTELFHNGTTSTHYLEIKKGGYCSEHRHTQKENIFYVIDGVLEITRWDWDEDKKIIIILRADECITLATEEWHMFRALTNVKCIEIYDYKYDGVDIERRVEGGRDEA